MLKVLDALEVPVGIGLAVVAAYAMLTTNDAFTHRCLAGIAFVGAALAITGLIARRKN